jgi:hypothetical protein
LSSECLLTYEINRFSIPLLEGLIESEEACACYDFCYYDNSFKLSSDLPRFTTDSGSF